MFKWIVLGLGAYLLFGKKNEEDTNEEDTKGPGYAAWKAANEQTIKLEKQAMPPGYAALIEWYQAKKSPNDPDLRADNPPKIHSVLIHGGVATWNYHTAAGGKANLTYFLKEGTTSADLSMGQAAPGWIVLDPTAELGTKYIKSP